MARLRNEPLLYICASGAIPLKSEHVTCEYRSCSLVFVHNIKMNVLAFHRVSLLNNLALYCFLKSWKKEVAQHSSPEQR